MKFQLYLSIFAVLLFTLSTFTIQDAYAIGGTISDQTSCEAIGGTWPATEECFVTNLTIDSGETLTVDAFVILVNVGLIENEGKIIVNELGGIGNFGHLFNSGTIYIRPQSAFSNVTPLQSLITNDGKILNAGFFSNFNVIGNSGTIVNTLLGTFTNEPLGVINNFGGDIRNSGSFTNDGGINNSCFFPEDDCGSSFRNQCGTYSGNPPNGNPVETVDCSDSDNDGIDDAVDTLPVTFSNDFENVGADFTPTSGTIIERGDQIISIIPWGYDEAVLISSHPAGGSLSAEYNVCGFMNFILNPGDFIVLECDSADIQVLNGQIDITFTDGTTTGTATLNGGDSIVFNPTSFSVTNNGDTPVTIIIDGNPIIIAPGETFSNKPDKVVGGIIIPIEYTSLILAGAQSTTWMVPLVLSLVGFGLFVVFRKPENS